MECWFPAVGTMRPVPSLKAVRFFLKLAQLGHPIWGDLFKIWLCLGDCCTLEVPGLPEGPCVLLPCPSLSLAPRQQPGIGPSGKGAAPWRGCCLLGRAFAQSGHRQGGRRAQPKALFFPEIALNMKSFILFALNELSWLGNMLPARSWLRPP